MVARIFRLRIALLVAPLKGQLRDVITASVLRALLVGLAVAVAWLPVQVTANNAELLPLVDIIVGSVMLITVFAVALFSAQAMQARLFQQYPLTPSKLALGLLVSAPVTWTGVAALTWAVTYTLTRANSSQTSLGITLTIVLSLVTLTVLGRFAGSLREVLFNSQRSQTLRRGLGALLLVCAVPLLALFAIMIFRDSGQQLASTAQVLTWTPFGAPFALAASIHDAATLSLHLGVTIATIALGVGGYLSFVTMVVQRVERPSPSASMSSSLGWFDYLPGNPAMSIGARALTYWMKDARYRVALAAIPVIPVLVLGVLRFAGMPFTDLALIPLPLVLIMVGWLIHNDIATDSTALWIHIAAGVRGRHDRFGRAVPVLVVGAPIVLFGTSLTVLLLGNWRAFPAVFALGFVALATSTGISSVVSVLRPYPTSRPGESPFVQPAWQGAGSGLAQTLAFLGSVVLTLPLVWAVFPGEQLSIGESFAIFAIGTVYGSVIAIAGIFLGGWIYNRRESELLAFTQVFD